VLNNLDEWLKESSDQLITNSLRQCYQTDVIVNETNPNWDLLTKRQRQLVEILLSGKSNKQISNELNLSGYTVENHLRNIYRKFGVRNRTALAAHFHR
jgi:DNA-binding NarL/FixJ family response regulator